MSFPTVRSPRTDLFITTALKPTAELTLRALELSTELKALLVGRRNDGLKVLFAANPEATRCLIVQTDRLLLVDKSGVELFYHPNMAFLRLGNILRGGRDLLIEAGGIREGDSVLDATLGHASEAILCAHVVGTAGEVHGIEAIPEVGILVREGLKTVTTFHKILNETMRRVVVVHLGDHLDYLRSCGSKRYDVVCFDPFFDEILPGSGTFTPLRTFGSHDHLLPEAIGEARRVARRCVVLKAVRWSDTLSDMGIETRVDSRSGKVVYGVLPALAT